jgi:hypothetical protein
VIALRTRGEAHRQLPHRSFWREALQVRAAPLDVDDWLVEQANQHGFFGAFRVPPAASMLDHDLSLEDIVVGLCMPHAPADARSLKLVVRILQSGRVDPARLALRARRERADFVLHWLLRIVPPEERNDALEHVAKSFLQPPRGLREHDFRYDPRRLVRRPFRRDASWPRTRS